jgi:hypothetical protein
MSATSKNWSRNGKFWSCDAMPLPVVIEGVAANPNRLAKVYRLVLDFIAPHAVEVCCSRIGRTGVAGTAASSGNPGRALGCHSGRNHPTVVKERPPHVRTRVSQEMHQPSMGVSRVLFKLID